jgi:hypothetical protein
MRHLKKWKLFESEDWRWSNEPYAACWNLISQRILWSDVLTNQVGGNHIFYLRLTQEQKRNFSEDDLIKSLSKWAEKSYNKEFFVSLPPGTMDEFYAFSKSFNSDTEYRMDEKRLQSFYVADYLTTQRGFENTNMIKGEALKGALYFFKSGKVHDDFSPEWIDI